VMAAVRFCREHDLPASVRCGGHAVAGHAICEGGVVIDLSAMTGSRVDPLARTSRSRAAACSRIWTERARRSGLAATGGIVSNTGLTLGGGTLRYVSRQGAGGRPRGLLWWCWPSGLCPRRCRALPGPGCAPDTRP
jgi:hypothetical protein